MVLVLRLKFERTNRQISQSRLALVAGLHQPVVSQIESGRLAPTREQLQKLAAVFGVRPSELLKDVAVLGPSR
jgi:transcriptional regulator with XRE-family HTH domain